MSVNAVKYRNWLFEVDKAQTDALYDEVKLSGTESCSCGTCKDFIPLKEVIYPQEIRELFKNLGIDIYKEFELCDYGDKAMGHIYNWWFHFVGRIIEGEDCNVPIPETGSTMNLFPINEIFEIGFTKAISISFFANHQDLIQIELLAKVPWDVSDIPKVIKNLAY